MQCKTARWVCESWWNPVSKHWSKSSDHCINHLEWPSLHQRHNYFTICQVHSILNHQTAIPPSQYFSMVNRHPSNPSVLDTSIFTIGPCRYSFFINSPLLWNNIRTCSSFLIGNLESVLAFPWSFVGLYCYHMYMLTGSEPISIMYWKPF